jgi:hypothetical protein
VAKSRYLASGMAVTRWRSLAGWRGAVSPYDTGGNGCRKREIFFRQPVIYRQKTGGR